MIAILAAGGSHAAAARAVGVHPAKLSRWLSRGKTTAPGGRWRRFAEEVTRVEALAPTLPSLELDPLFPTVESAWRYLEQHEFREPIEREEVPTGPTVIQLTF